MPNSWAIFKIFLNSKSVYQHTSSEILNSFSQRYGLRKFNTPYIPRPPVTILTCTRQWKHLSTFHLPGHESPATFFIPSVVLSFTLFVGGSGLVLSQSWYIGFMLLQGLFSQNCFWKSIVGFWWWWWCLWGKVGCLLLVKFKTKNPFFPALLHESCSQQGFISQAQAQRSSHRDCQCETA